MVIGVQISWNFIFGGTVLVQFLLGGTILENNFIWGNVSTKRLRTAGLVGCVNVKLISLG